MSNITLPVVDFCAEILRQKKRTEKKVQRLQNEIDRMVEKMNFEEKDLWIETSNKINKE